MGRVLTNNVSLSYTIETSLGVAGTEWFLLEPNAINTFGANITTVAREPISKNRQRRKGTTTDLDSAVEFDEDITLSSFRDFIQCFVFAKAVNVEVTDIIPTAAETTGDTYTIPSVTTEQAPKLGIDTIVFVSGFVESLNNGLKTVRVAAVATDTALDVNENLADESPAPDDARLSFAGYRIPATDSPTWTWSPGTKTAVLNNTGVGTLLQTRGLTVGEMVHIGSADSFGGTIQNAFENSSPNDMFGYARVKSITANDVTFDKVDAALQFTDATAPATPVDVLYGEFVRNVPVDDADYLEQSIQFEAEFPNLDEPNPEYQYSIGNYCNQVTFNLPLTDKAVSTFGFIGTDTENPVTQASRKTGAANALQPTFTSAFNTSSDIARLRIQDVDESGLTTDFKNVSLTLNNNVSPEKVLGQLGAKFLNTGNFEVDIETQLLFTNGEVINRIRDNTTVTMDFIIKNDNGAITVDIPSMTLGGGDREFPVNESVLLNTTGLAFQDPTLNTSIGISIFPFVP